MTEVLVASSDLTQGQALNEAALRWQPWPMNAISPGFITRAGNPDAVKSFSGLMVRSHFVAGEPIREEKISRTFNLLAAMLPAGKRAVAIRISVESTAGGFILPNDRVDVIRTFRDDETSRSGGSDVHVSETILSNIRVLAIGQTVQERNGEKVVTGETATLELTPSQVELVTLAQKVGQLSLALRSLTDANQTEAVADARGDAGLTIVRYGVSKQAPKR